jgi:hypothetical protein
MTLGETYRYVKKNFFPSWDRENVYKVRVVYSLPSVGRFDSVKKQVLIKVVPENQIELLNLLIHEISHSMSPCHGKRWKERIRKASQRADELGQKDLSLRLLMEIRNYSVKEISPYDTAEVVYGRLRQAITDTKAEVSLLKLVASLARDYGSPVRNFMKRFRKLSYHYRRGVIEHKTYLARRKKFEESMAKEN